MVQIGTWIDGNIAGENFYNDLTAAGVKYELGRVDRSDFTQEICLEEKDIGTFTDVLKTYGW